MYKKIRSYMGEYLRFTRRSAVAVTIAVILNVIPCFLLYQLVSPLLVNQPGGASHYQSAYAFHQANRTW